MQAGARRTRDSVGAFLPQQVAAGQLQIPPDRLRYAAMQLLNTAVGMYQMSLWLGLLHAVDPAEVEAHLQRVVDDFLTLYRP